MKTYTFNRFGLRLLFPMFIIIAVLILFSTLFEIKQNPLILIFIFILFIFLVYTFYMSFIRKIILSQEGVIFKSPFGFKQIDWENIKTYGIFLRRNYSGTELSEADLKKKFITGNKYIYVSENEENQLTNQIKDGYISFQYNKEAYDFIKKKAKKK